MAEKMRVRVRPLAAVPTGERDAWTRQHCLSTPHVGEAIDKAGDSYRLYQAAEEYAGTGRIRGRELHYGHQLGQKCDTVELETDQGRCLYVDYVPETAEKDQDELDVAGLVGIGRAG